MTYLKTILEVFTSWFQRAKAWEHEFGRVPSISFIFTGSKMARIAWVYYADIWCDIKSSPQWSGVCSLIGRLRVRILAVAFGMTYFTRIERDVGDIWMNATARLHSVLGSLPIGTSVLRRNCYITVCILSRKTNHFGKDSQPKLPLWHLWLSTALRSVDRACDKHDTLHRRVSSSWPLFPDTDIIDEYIDR